MKKRRLTKLINGLVKHIDECIVDIAWFKKVIRNEKIRKIHMVDKLDSEIYQLENSLTRLEKTLDNSLELYSKAKEKEKDAR